MASTLEELYREDFYAWTRDQAAALRGLAGERWNGPLDLDRLAEEIEDVGSERRSAVESQLRRAIVHLLKLEHSPAARPRRKWAVSVADARAEAGQRLTRAIRHEVEGALATIYRQARKQARLQLLHRQETTAAAALPATLPYSLDQLLDEDWYPANRHGLADDPQP